jgi:hypothetical protein
VRDGVPQAVQTTQIALLVLAIWLGLSQLAPITLGWSLLRPQDQRGSAPVLNS